MAVVLLSSFVTIATEEECKTHLHLIPWDGREISLSAKAAYYMDFTPGIILFSDNKDHDPDFPVFYLCKNMGQLLLRKLDNNISFQIKLIHQ